MCRRARSLGPSSEACLFDLQHARPGPIQIPTKCSAQNQVSRSRTACSRPKLPPARRRSSGSPRSAARRVRDIARRISSRLVTERVNRRTTPGRVGMTHDTSVIVAGGQGVDQSRAEGQDAPVGCRVEHSSPRLAGRPLPAVGLEKRGGLRIGPCENSGTNSVCFGPVQRQNVRGAFSQPPLLVPYLGFVT